MSNCDGRANRHQGIGSHPTLTFRDVEDALETFSEDGSRYFQRWITNFEDGRLEGGTERHLRKKTVAWIRKTFCEFRVPGKIVE